MYPPCVLRVPRPGLSKRIIGVDNNNGDSWDDQESELHIVQTVRLHELTLWARECIQLWQLQALLGKTELTTEVGYPAR